MSRFFHTAVALGALSTLVACGGSEDPAAAGGTTASASSDDSTSEGYVFKGPMGTEGSVTIQPLGPDLEDVGPAFDEPILSEDGAYAVDVPGHQGLVLITATGPVFNEAVGAKHPDELITLEAYGEVGARTSVHVNLLTDLIKERLATRLLEGVPFTEAEDQVVQEFFDALEADARFSNRQRPQVRGSDIDPHTVSYEAAWLLGFSSIVAEAGRIDPNADDDQTDTHAVMDLIRDDFGDDGALSAATFDLLAEAEERFDPGLVELGLEHHHQTHMPDAPPDIPDIHTFLDSDHDGIVNIDDNCWDVENADQAPVSGMPFG